MKVWIDEGDKLPVTDIPLAKDKVGVSFFNGLEWVPIEKIDDKKLNPNIIEVSDE